MGHTTAPLGLVGLSVSYPSPPPPLLPDRLLVTLCLCMPSPAYIFSGAVHEGHARPPVAVPSVQRLGKRARTTWMPRQPAGAK